MTGEPNALNVDDLVRRYQAGESALKIGRSLGFKRGDAVMRLLRQAGVKLHSRSEMMGAAWKSRRHTLPASVITDYAAGESEKSLADRFGVARYVIRRHLIEAKIQPRSQGEAERVKWESMSGERRAAQVAAAHVANRGRKASFEELCRRATAREHRQSHVSQSERDFAAILSERGIETRLQKAIGPYNCDIAAEPVAVEIFGGNWHATGRHAERAPKRTRYLLNAGWHVVMIWVTGAVPLAPEAADYVAAFVKRARRKPAMRREYRMIRGAAQELARGSADDDEITVVIPLTSRRNALGQYESVPR